MKRLFSKKEIEESKDYPWDELTPFGEYKCRFISDHENNILAIPYSPGNPDGIYKYNGNKNKWQLCISFPQNYDFFSQMAVLCSNGSELYAVGVNDIHTVDLESKIFNKTVRHPSRMGKIVFIDNELHSFQGTVHFKLNPEKENKFERVSTASRLGLDASNFVSNGLCHIEELKKIFIFGGKDDGRRMDIIWYYDIIQNKMIKCLDVKLPYAMSDFVYCYHKGSGNIFVIGGCNTFGVSEYDIIIWNVHNNTIRISDIQLTEGPMNDGEMILDAVIAPHPMDKLIVTGYLRKYGQDLYSKLPLDIVNSIKMWYKTDRLHIFGNNAHYRLDIQKILQSGSIERTIERPHFTMRFAL